MEQKTRVAKNKTCNVKYYMYIIENNIKKGDITQNGGNDNSAE
jgi:hypothetical protein